MNKVMMVMNKVRMVMNKMINITKVNHDVMPMLTLDSCSAKSPSFCYRGALISSVFTMFSLILPMVVAEPVSMTAPLALPMETMVSENTMFFLSWLMALGSGTASQC